MFLPDHTSIATETIEELFVNSVEITDSRVTRKSVNGEVREILAKISRTITADRSLPDPHSVKFLLDCVEPQNGDILESFFCICQLAFCSGLCRQGPTSRFHFAEKRSFQFDYRNWTSTQRSRQKVEQAPAMVMPTDECTFVVIKKASDMGALSR